MHHCGGRLQFTMDEKASTTRVSPPPYIFSHPTTSTVRKTEQKLKWLTQHNKLAVLAAQPVPTVAVVELLYLRRHIQPGAGLRCPAIELVPRSTTELLPLAVGHAHPSHTYLPGRVRLPIPRDRIGTGRNFWWPSEIITLGRVPDASHQHRSRTATSRTGNFLLGTGYRLWSFVWTSALNPYSQHYAMCCAYHTIYEYHMYCFFKLLTHEYINMRLASQIWINLIMVLRLPIHSSALLMIYMDHPQCSMVYGIMF